MIKRTLYFGNPNYLSTKDEQLLITARQGKTLEDEVKTVPIEDIGVMILDHPQITVTQALTAKLLENNVALITCNNTHHPVGLFLPLDGSSVQGERFRAQLDTSEPLRKQLWAQTVSAKITNQAALLEELGIEATNMMKWSRDVTSGDPKNLEARAAAYYWANLFTPIIGEGFKRDRFGLPPNNLLNYGYAILRAIVARALVGSGMLPTFGIHHKNKYNAYCLADDIMEPYRPSIDRLVVRMIANVPDYAELSPTLKREMLTIPVFDTWIDGDMRPLMVAVSHTTASLASCFLGEKRKILYPLMHPTTES